MNTSPPTMTRPSSPYQEARSRTPGIRSAASWAELVYCLINLIPAIIFFVLIAVLLTVGAGLSIIWLGLPVLIVGLVIARAGGAVQRILGVVLLDTGLQPPEPLLLSGLSPAEVGKAILADRTAWRAVTYHFINLLMAPVQFVCAIAFYLYGLAAITYSVWRPFLPGQVGADGVVHRGAQMWPDFFIDTWPRMTVLAVVGIGVLFLAPRVVRFLTDIDRELMRTLLGGVSGR